ncbi:hypothetical protein A2U01_0053483, partial [Trifolium medium]|nr:hypothetical protein [Trifolium medium]
RGLQHGTRTLHWHHKMVDKVVPRGPEVWVPPYLFGVDMAESVHMASVPGQNVPPSSQNFLEAQIGSTVDIYFAEADLAGALPMAVEVGALGRSVVGIVLESWLPRKDVGGKVFELEAFLRYHLKRC